VRFRQPSLGGVRAGGPHARRGMPSLSIQQESIRFAPLSMRETARSRFSAGYVTGPTKRMPVYLTSEYGRGDKTIVALSGKVALVKEQVRERSCAAPKPSGSTFSEKSIAT
jgi:hypothetical protein